MPTGLSTSFATRVVIDTNVLVSAIMFGGLPGEIWELVLVERVEAVTSPILIEELFRILSQKMKMTPADLSVVKGQIEEIFLNLYPREIFKILADDPDNRVLEAAVEGRCAYVITGDKALLKLKEFRKIKIVTVSDFFASWTKLKV